MSHEPTWAVGHPELEAISAGRRVLANGRPRSSSSRTWIEYIRDKTDTAFLKFLEDDSVDGADHDWVVCWIRRYLLGRHYFACEPRGRVAMQVLVAHSRACRAPLFRFALLASFAFLQRASHSIWADLIQPHFHEFWVFMLNTEFFLIFLSWFF